MTITVEMDAKSAAAPELATLRILLVHEWLYTWAGSERCLEQLKILMPHADILAGIVTDSMRRSHATAAQARESWVGRLPGARAHHRWFLPLHALAFATFDTSPYDLIVSVSHSFEKAIRARKRGAVHVCYCLTPPRYLYDLRSDHEKLASPLQRVALRAAGPMLRAVDRAAASGVHHFVSLAMHVAERIRRQYRRESAVVYPPVSAKAAGRTAAAREDFLLYLGRLVPYKRVDLAIAAAERLGVRLVIAGDGPERERLTRMAGPATRLLGQVSEAEAGHLLSTCRAFVFCAEEDFGIAPVEANAHGAPVVAFAQGGARETVVHGKTGVLFTEPTVDSLCAAIRDCLGRSWDEAELHRNAQRFSPDNFRDGMRREIHRALGGVA